MKKELLAPAGDFETLKQAIHNGADAIYLGGKKFGARKFASNFDEEEMVSAIKYCHLYGVKIYVTVNTMIYEEELEEVVEYVSFLHHAHVDAVIIQDLGLIKILREKFPNLELHASTQLHNHNQEQLKFLEELGIKRVVVARELSLDEINNLNTKGPDRVSPMYIPMAISNMAAGNIAIEFGFKGESISIVTACASSTHAIGEAYKKYPLALLTHEADLEATYFFNIKKICCF